MKNGSIIERFFSSIQRLIFRDIGTKFQAGLFKNIMDFFFVIFEKMSSSFYFISNVYVEMYHDIVNEEINMAHVSSKDRVLVIGCGSIPSTAILIAKEIKNIKIVAIDHDTRAIKKASQYIKDHELKASIDIQHNDGVYYPVKDFDVIFVSYGVKKRLELLKYLSDNISQASRIIFRTAEDDNRKPIGESSDLSKLFIVKDKIKTSSFGLMDSFLLSKI